MMSVFNAFSKYCLNSYEIEILGKYMLINLLQHPAVAYNL